MRRQRRYRICPDCHGIRHWRRLRMTIGVQVNNGPVAWTHIEATCRRCGGRGAVRR